MFSSLRGKYKSQKRGFRSTITAPRHFIKSLIRKTRLRFTRQLPPPQPPPPQPRPQHPLSLPDEILPYLYLGDARHPNATVIQACGLTHVISIGWRPRLDPPSTTPHYFYPLEDVPGADIGDAVTRTAAVINEAKARDGGAKILVHCQMGISRSAAVVAAYLMREEKMRLAEALQLIQRARPEARPNHGFISQLSRMERQIWE